MKLTVPALMTAVLIASPAAFAQGVSNQSPGQRMQSQTKQHEGYPGASYYAPGQQKKNPKAKHTQRGSRVRLDMLQDTRLPVRVPTTRQNRDKFLYLFCGRVAFREAAFFH